MDVKLRVASAEDKTLYKNLFNIYQNELGLYCSEFQDVDALGYYDSRSTDVFFAGDEAIIPLIIDYCGRIVGFTVITLPPYCPDAFDYCIQEFFIVGYYRGKGVAQAAINAIFDLLNGNFVAAVQTKNVRACVFFGNAFKERGGTVQDYSDEFKLFTCTNKRLN